MTSWTLTFADENGEFIPNDNAEILTETSDIFDAADQTSKVRWSVNGRTYPHDIDDVFGEQVGGYRINVSKLQKDFAERLILKRRFED